ncbi:MAG: hypothetical protein COX65_10500 [Elusimicrobia bacterium CG_4_10_14_0_2_um_filter_56_8]|nr:MAG: hypothetical protein AUJ51_05395 [Elusimicrobia bacterium CG1_02_56_21]PJA11418.1 MAG: hypothetical protein COX65_10500 [Elusimicrobia bacterium CG_4_10_14_0_2_um_filter_56_8]
MKRILLNCAALLLTCPAYAAAPAGTGITKSPVREGLRQQQIKTGDIVVNTPVTGITTAQDTYDIFAPFDGRIEELQAEIFSFASPKTLLARMVSTEMAALLDSSSEESRKQTARRWQDVYSYKEIKPGTQGMVTNIYIQPGTRVNRGDRLFTIAKKVVIVGKNTEPLYSKLAPGMNAKVEHVRSPDEKYDTTLVNFVSLKGAPLIYRLWMEVLDLKDGIKIGQQYDGTLFVGKSENTMLVPRGHVIESDGRRFLITEIKSGLETAGEIEILGHSSMYLEPVLPAAEAKNGKDKKKL